MLNLAVKWLNSRADGSSRIDYLNKLWTGDFHISVY